MGKKSVFAGMSWDEITDKYSDCPEKLFGLAKTDFEKAVAVEFFIVHKKIDERNERFGKVEKDISWCKWLVTAMFAVVAIGTLATYIPQVLHSLGF